MEGRLFHDALVSLYENILQHIECNEGTRFGDGGNTEITTAASVSSSASTTNTDGNNTVEKNISSTYYKWDMIYDKIGKPTGEPFDEVVSTCIRF